MTSLMDISKDTLKGALLHQIVADLREKEDAFANTDEEVIPGLF